MQCPSDDEIAAFMGGLAPPDVAGTVRRHLGTCEVCANLVGDYAAAFGLPAETIEDGRDGPTPSRSCKPGT